MSLGVRNMENDNLDSKSDLINQIYQENIIQTLESVSINVCKIEPLDYRLEILENIYALIFIKSTDLFKNTEYETDLLNDDYEDFEIVETFDKDMEFLINEYSASIKQVIKENHFLKNNFDINYQTKFKRNRKSRNKSNKEKQDVSPNMNKNYSKKIGDEENFLINDFLCRDILITLKNCLNLFKPFESNFDKIYLRSKKLLQLVNETLWRFQLIKPGNLKVSFGQISILTKNVQNQHIFNDYEQNLVYHFMRKRQKRCSNISSNTNYNSIKNENLNMSLNRSFKYLELRIFNGHQNKCKKLSLASYRSSSLIYTQVKNRKTKSIIMKLISDIRTLSVLCLKEFKSNEANQLVKLYSTKQNSANLFEFRQISFNNIIQNSIDKILLLDSQKSTETIHEQSLFNLKISKIIDNLIQDEKAKPLIQSLIICDFFITLKVDIKIIVRFIEFVSINLNKKETLIFLDSDIQSFDKKIQYKVLSYIDSIKNLETILKKDFFFKKEHFFDYITSYDGISVFAKYFERNISKMFEKINDNLESIKKLDLLLDELDSCDNTNFDNVYCKILDQFKNKMSKDFIKFFVINSLKTENSKSNDYYSLGDFNENIETLFQKRDNFCTQESISLDFKNNFSYLMSFNDYNNKLFDFLRDKSFQTNFKFKINILDFSPALLICKLLFDDFLDPVKIEPLTKNLNLNLTAIILHNSCPRLKLISCETKSTCFTKNDTLNLSSNVSVYGNDFFYSILNENNVYSCLMKKPHIFIKDLLHSILKYFTLQSIKKIDAKSVWKIYNSTEFKIILKQTQQIQNLNLEYLQTKNEKLSFFINLHNLLSIHANLVLVSSKFSKTKISKKNSINREKILNDSSFFDDSSEIILHKNYTFKILFQQKMCYKVGQMGCVSLFDLKHFILLRRKREKIKPFISFSIANKHISPLINLKNSQELSSSSKFVTAEKNDLFKCEIEPNDFSLLEMDLKIEPSWSKYIPKTIDIRVMFALINCVESDPKICVYDSDETLDSHLELQMKNFFNQTVYVDSEKEILYIPSILLENLSCFSNVTSYQKISNLYQLNFDQNNDSENIFKILIDLVDPKLKKDIKKLINFDSIHSYGENIGLYEKKDLSFKIIGLKNSETFCLSLDNNLPDEKIKWYKTQYENRLIKENIDKNKDNFFLEKEVIHSKKLLNLECLEYISKNSPLIFKNLGFLFDVQIREKFFTELNEINVKNLIEYERDTNNSNNSFFKRFIQLYVPLDFMNYLNMDSKLYMLTQFLFNSENEKFKFEKIIGLANYYCLKYEWKNVIDLLENCTHDNEEFFDFRELTQLSNSEFSVKFVTEINCLNTYSKSVHKDIYNLFDHACLSYVNQQTKDFDKSYCYLFKINNFKRQIRAVFGLMFQWSIDGCLEVIDFLIQKCRFFQLSHLNSNENEYLFSLIDALIDKKKEFSAYQDLITCAQNILEKYYEHQQVQESVGLYDSNNPIWSFSTIELNDNYILNFKKMKKFCQLCLNWQYLKGQLEISSNQDNLEAKEWMIDFLLINEKFENAKYIIKKFKLNQNLGFKVDFCHLKYRLLNFNTLSSVIEIDLDSILNECISFSRENVLEYDFNLFNICYKLINELKDYNDLNNQVLISLSEFLIQKFNHRLNNQQFNELKIIQLTAKIFQIIVQEKGIYFDSYKRHHSQPIFIIEQLLMNGKIDLCAKTIKLCRNNLKSTKLNNDINQLLVIYAHKALEFHLYNDTKKDYNDEEKLYSYNFQLKTFNKSIRSKIKSGSSPRKNSILSNFKTIELLFEEHSPKVSNNKFIIPIVPPNREDWIKDEEVNDCMVCKVSKFSLINRRHHCRRCGRVVCGLCSQKLTMIQNEAKRTCDDCFRHLESLENDKTSSKIETKSQRIKQKCLILAQDINSQSNDEKNSFYLIGDSMNETSVKRDKLVKKEFRYLQSPSTSLCLSILDLHDNLFECGKSLLSLCDDLSLYLQNTNQQDDHGLVINMLKHLLQNAKVKLLQNSSSNIISLCDSYLSLVDILEQLLLANCSIIPSLNELIDSESVHRIRNRLLEEERHELAMNLSTKSGLDTQTVWASWGLIELKRSNYKEARRKFEKCLKPLSEKNSLNNPMNLKILNDIINYFETTSPIRMLKVRIIPSGLILRKLNIFFYKT